jgi:omega-amidase
MHTDRVAQTINGECVQWMKDRSHQMQTAIMGSLVIEEKGNYYNRMLFVTPEGNLHQYDKHHLFRMGNEDKVYQKGKTPTVIEYKGWRIKPIICYDLRFPVWIRSRNDYDLLVCIANWPASRRNVFTILLKARAIENQCYVAGVNRVGNDGNGLQYLGDSMIIDPKGEIINSIEEGKVGIGFAELSLTELNQFREKFPVMPDADDFELKIG